jgi:hypothetical protein
MRSTALLFPVLFVATAVAADPFEKGEAIPLDATIPANERGIVCLARSGDGRIYGGTTGRAAHLFVCDPKDGSARSVHRLDGGVGFAHALIALADGTLIGGTQSDPTGLALQTNSAAVGHLYHFRLAGAAAVAEDLGVPVKGQGIYTLAYYPETATLVGNTWPDGHFFTFDVKARAVKDHGAIAGFRTYEQPQHAEDLNRHGADTIHYARQVSRAIVVVGDHALTAGADGSLYRYDFKAGKLTKLAARLPSVRGRESWASLDAALAVGDRILGGTSDGYLFSLTGPVAPNPALTSLGRPLRQGGTLGLVSLGEAGVAGLGGDADGVPRTFALGESPFHLDPGGIPLADGQPALNGFGALLDAGDGVYFAGERDRIARLVRFQSKPQPKKAAPAAPATREAPVADNPPPLDFQVVFAPAGTTTDGSGYTAIEVGKDGRVYAGAARYGGYASLLRFDPMARPTFMDRVVGMRELTGEDRGGINTQGKIHAKIQVGADGKVWFASKQAHEIFETRPEYGADADGFPGGHLCFYDPKTGFSRSLGIQMKQEGLVAGAIDDARAHLYYRGEPKNHFLAYDLKAGRVRDRGHLGAACRYMAIDRQGRVYTAGRGDYLARYDPTTGYVEDLRVRVEGAGGYTAPYVLGMGSNGKLYGLTAGHNGFMEFDIDRAKDAPFPEITVRNAAPAAPPGWPVDDIHAAIFGKDGKLYFPLNTTGPINGKTEWQLRLMRFDPATRKTETVGIPRVIGFDEEKVKHAYPRNAKFALRYMQGAAVGEDGSLYLLGIYPQLHVACFPRLTAPK